MQRGILLGALLFACRYPAPEERSAPVSVLETAAPAAPAPGPAAAAETPPEAAGVDPAFVSELLGIAAEYQSYGRTDDFFHWAPAMCALPMAIRPAAYVSASGDDDTHGKKLYSLFAGLRAKAPPVKADAGGGDYLSRSDGFYPITAGQSAYLDIAKGKPVPEGLALVKESWRPEEVKDRREAERLHGSRSAPEQWDYPARPAARGARPGSEFWPYAEKGGVLYAAKEKAGLFIMYKAAKDTPGTDEGWVYGTVSADGKTVTSAGRVASCMGCHKRAAYGRLFIDKKPGG
jgi:hypothetical protein